MAEMMTKNPAPDLFMTFERVENCHRVEVTEENLHLLAKFFGWRVAYDLDPARLVGPDGSAKAEVGSWVDVRGNRWSLEPLSAGWSPEGTFPEPFQGRRADGSEL